MITCVTAPSRSGTSLTMQMLLNAGVPVAWDSLPNRKEWNERGFYELNWKKADEEKRIAETLNECEGHAVKVMPFYLHMLTPDHDYQFITILRDIKSIDRSQAHTVQWRGSEMGDAHKTKYWQNFMFNFVKHYRHCTVKFDDLFGGAGQGRIGAFLDMTPLQIAKMCDCVDHSMRHFKPEAR
jgi:hypothetical protein